MKEESFAVMEEVFDFLQANPEVEVEIGGHTNNIPPHEYCDKLSKSRAQSVATYLYDKGLSEKKIAFRGYGKRKPIANNRSAAGRKKNQRVEIKILKIKS